jgi:large subunit ribosomal protein L9
VLHQHRSHNMEVILKEDVPKLGHRGDLVKVAEGYGRNFLLPKKLAIEATAGNKKVIEQMKASAVRKAQKDKTDAEALAAQLNGVTVTITRRAGEQDQLFGSVTSSDVAAELEKKGFTIDRRKLEIDQPIKTVGEFNIPVRLFREVTATVKLEVKKEEVAE